MARRVGDIMVTPGSMSSLTSAEADAPRDRTMSMNCSTPPGSSDVWPRPGFPEVLIPWGPGERLALRMAESWRLIDVTQPLLDDALASEEYEARLGRLLDDPASGWSETLATTPLGRVALVIDDPSRWTPVERALPVVLERLERAGVGDDSIDLVVAVGRHRPVDREAMVRRLGAELTDRLRWWSPPVDDPTAYDDLGTIDQDLPVRLFRPVVQADLRVLIGSTLPHLQAGFGGGWKLILPGCAHRSSLAAVHRRGIRPEDHPETLLGGDPDLNPMRQAITRAMTLLPGKTFSIGHVLGVPGQILRVEAGCPDEVQRRLAHEARRRFQAPFRPPAEVVVVGNSPWPGDPLQSFKALIHHRAACRPGGALVGLFWASPDELDRSLDRRSLRRLGRGGRPAAWLIRHGLGLADRLASIWKLRPAFMIHWARELVVDRAVFVYCPLLHQVVGPHLGPVRLFDSLEALWNAVEVHLDQAGSHFRSAVRGGVRVRVFPQGGLTYCRPSSIV